MSALNNNVKNSIESNLAKKLNTGFVDNEAQLLGKQPLAHQNPLDRNRDGRVDFKDLTGRPGMNQGVGLNQNIHHNPLDRNFDGRVDANDFAGRSSSTMLNSGIATSGIMNQGILPTQTAYIQSGQRSSLGLVRAEPTVREVIQKDTVIHEHIHPVQKEEIQPIIYREREQLDVKQITQMMHETQIRPTVLEQRELPAERREAIVERGAPIAPNVVLPLSEVDVTTRTQVVHAPIVNEIIKKTVIEEIQPVLERDVYQSTVIQNTQPIYEKIIEAPQVTREVRHISQEFSSVELQGQRLSGNYSEFSGNRRLSQNYGLQSGLQQQMLPQQGLVQQGLVQQGIVEPALLGNRRLSQNYGQNNMGETLLTKRGLESVGTNGLPLTQGQGISQPIYNGNNRLSQNYGQGLQQQMLPQQELYNEPLLQNRRLSQNYGQGLQQQMLPQQGLAQQGQWGVNTGIPPAPGMNNTGLGMATAIPSSMAAPMMNIGQPNRLSQNLGQGPLRYANSSSNYGLQATPAYQGSVQQEKLRELEREQMIRQEMPLGFNRI